MNYPAKGEHMAITPVKIPAIVKQKEAESGLGVFGNILGAIVGAAGVIATGGLAAPAIAAAGGVLPALGGVATAAGTGAGIGGLAGGIIKPGSAGSISQQEAPAAQQTAISRKLSQTSKAKEESPFAQLASAYSASKSASPEIQSISTPHILKAMLRQSGVA